MTNLTGAPLVDDRPEARIFRIRRDLFSDPEIYERELLNLFEGGWIFLAHESQIPKVNDYLTVYMGRRPVVLMRGTDNVVRAFHNACPHKGAVICSRDRGNAPVHTCPYHSWSFASDGQLKGIKAKAAGGYTEDFLGRRLDLVPIAKFDGYRGFYFGSLAPDVPSLADYLGDMRVFLDLVVDQSPDGTECLPGISVFTYNGNWKFQVENCSDGYHVTSVHPTYIKASQRRAESAKQSEVSGVWNRVGTHLGDADVEVSTGSFRFPHGHLAIWARSPMSESHPLFDRREELIARVGPVRSKWMFYTRNFTIFPNLQIAENFSSQLRVIRPLLPGKTEMTTYCLGPRGEATAARRQRLRQYEDFFNPSGMATPDDLVVYEKCQLTAAPDRWQGYERGWTAQVAGSDPEADELGVKPLVSVRGVGQLWDETHMQGYYQAWRERMALASTGSAS